MKVLILQIMIMGPVEEFNLCINYHFLVDSIVEKQYVKKKQKTKTKTKNKKPKKQTNKNKTKQKHNKTKTKTFCSL